jgi:hypothetical protein
VLETAVQDGTARALERQRDAETLARVAADDDEDGLGGGSSYKTSSATAASKPLAASAAAVATSAAAKKLQQRREDAAVVEALLAVAVDAHFLDAPLAAPRAVGATGGYGIAGEPLAAAWGVGVPAEAAAAVVLRSLRTQAGRVATFAAALQHAPLTEAAASQAGSEGASARRLRTTTSDAGGGARCLVACKVLPAERSLVAAWVSASPSEGPEGFAGGDTVCFLKMPTAARDATGGSALATVFGGKCAEDAARAEAAVPRFGARLAWPLGRWRVACLALYGGDAGSPAVNEDHPERVLAVLQDARTGDLKLAT